MVSKICRGETHGDDQVAASEKNGLSSRRTLHRIGKVRRQMGVSLIYAARPLGTEAPHLESQEEETANLHLSDVYAWRHVLLKVPAADLLIEPDGPLQLPNLERNWLVRMIKKAQAILRQTRSKTVRCMAWQVIAQLTDIMPELGQDRVASGVDRRCGEPASLLDVDHGTGERASAAEGRSEK